ncbi:MAG: hypothetical protein U1C71_03840 [archaeon]|nr:hypothetical protein [archaeon]
MDGIPINFHRDKLIARRIDIELAGDRFFYNKQMAARAPREALIENL